MVKSLCKGGGPTKSQISFFDYYEPNYKFFFSCNKNRKVHNPNFEGETQLSISFKISSTFSCKKKNTKFMTRISQKKYNYV